MPTIRTTNKVLKLKIYRALFDEKVLQAKQSGNSLQFQIAEMLSTNRGDYEISTQLNRIKVLLGFADDIGEHDCRLSNIVDLETSHIIAVVNSWKAKGVKVRTIKNRLVFIRWLAAKIGKPDLLPPDNRLFDIGKVNVKPASRLAGEFRRLCREHRDGYRDEKKERLKTLLFIAQQLKKGGYQDLTINTLETLHIQLLLFHWKSIRVDRATINSCMDALRWLSIKAAKPHIIPAN